MEPKWLNVYSSVTQQISWKFDFFSDWLTTVFLYSLYLKNKIK